MVGSLLLQSAEVAKLLRGAKLPTHDSARSVSNRDIDTTKVPKICAHDLNVETLKTCIQILFSTGTVSLLLLFP